MKYCTRCGRELFDDARFCSYCGLPQPERPTPTVTALVPVSQPYDAAPSVPRHKSGIVLLLVWSLMLVPFFNPLGTPLAVAAALLCLAFDAAPPRQGDSRRLLAVLFCAFATAADLLTLFLLLFSSLSAVRQSFGL